MRARFFPLCFLVSALFSTLLSGCAITKLVEWGGRKLSRGPYKNGLRIDEDAGKLYYSRSFPGGWMEFTADWAEDEGVIVIESGALRREDTIIKGSEALSILKNRLDRLEAIAGWMAESEFAKKPESEAEFESYWKAVLLPETVKKKLRPAAYTRSVLVSPASGFAEGYRWNLAYTERLFPADKSAEPDETSDNLSLNGELAKLRNSGALYRDFEEALPWLYLEARAFLEFRNKDKSKN